MNMNPKHHLSLAFLRKKNPSLMVSLGLFMGLATTGSESWADAPLRGNPVDSLPPINAPAPSTRAPSLNIPPAAAQSQLQQQLQLQLVVRSFDVSGSRSIPFEQITAILEPLAGKTLSIAQLINEVNKITALYQQQGYPLSFAILQQQDF